MNIHNYVDEMKNIQFNLLQFLDKQIDAEENYEKLIQYFKNHDINDDKNLLKSVLYLILRISNNHRRTSFFFPKNN